MHRPAVLVVSVAVLLLGGVAHAGADTFEGVVHAPPGKRALGKVILVACWAPQGRCEQDAGQTRAIEVESGASSTEFELSDVEPGRYYVIAIRDLNANGKEDRGDWTGDVLDAGGKPKLVEPGARVDVVMRVVGEPPPPAPSTNVAAASGVPQSPRAAPPPAPAKPGGLRGIYHGVTKSLIAPGPGSLVQAGITWLPTRDWFALFPDGRALAALPEEGMRAPFDWSQCSDDLTYCPTYSVTGKKVVLRWQSGFEKSYQLQPDGSLDQGGIRFVKLPSLDGVKLEGRYVSVGNEYRTGWIAFRKDGAFEERKLLADIAWREVGSYRELTDAERRGGTGTYAIEQNTLELRYSDGRVVRTSIYAMPDDAKQARPPKLYLRSWDYHLQQ